MTLEAVSAVGALVIATGTALGTLYRGWRRRLQDAARRPFLVGQAAVEEAETALRLKDRRLNELVASESALQQKLAAAEGAARAQSEQLTDLQAQMYRLQSANRDLQVRAETAEAGLATARSRIGTLEDTVADLQRKLSLNGPPY